MTNLAWCYMQGCGIEKNPEKAFSYYRKAADLHYAEAYLELGKCYLNGNGVEQNFAAFIGRRVPE